MEKISTIKTATIKDASNPQVDLFLKNLRGDDNSVYIHIPAVAAGEHWGPNNWGDYFPEKSLRDNYKSFYNAKVYRRHNNKDPRKSIGDVVLSTYNDGMHRVELVVRIYRDLAPDIARKADNNEPVGFSMGCKVPYEECSVCGKKIHKTKDRCDHLKYSMNKYAEGQKVYAINRYPDFFDISETPKPADTTMWSIKKVASLDNELTFDDALLGHVVLSEYYRDFEKRSVDIDLDSLRKIAAEPLGDVITTALAHDIVLKPAEFQYCYLTDAGHQKLAERLYEQDVCFEHLDEFLDTPFREFDDADLDETLKEAGYSTKVAAYIDDYSGRVPMNPDQSVMENLADQAKEEVRNLIFMADRGQQAEIKRYPDVLRAVLGAGILYGAYRIGAARLTGTIGEILQSGPASLFAGLAAIKASKQMVSQEKTAGFIGPAVAGLSGSYLLSSEAWRRYKTGREIPKPLKFVAENPTISAVGIGLLSHKVVKIGRKVLKKKMPVTKMVKGASEEVEPFVENEETIENMTLRSVLAHSDVSLDNAE